MALTIGQDSHYEGNSSWTWRAWIEGPDEQLDAVDHVIYVLHPTFPEPERVVRDRESKFRLEAYGWGVFRLYATVVYKDGTEEPLERDLVFESASEEFPVLPGAEAPAPVKASPGTHEQTAPWRPEGGDADGVFEGGAAAPIAIVGALLGAEDTGKVTRWVNLVGSSGGALVAALLAVGYQPRELDDLLRETDLERFLDRGPWGIFGQAFNLLGHQGMASGKYFTEWLRDRFEERLGKRDPTFADVVDPELVGSLSPTGKYRLRTIASDITSGRMIVFPDDVEQYTDRDGRPFRRDDFPLTDAVRMSMSIPIVFTPQKLHRQEREYYVVDGRLLSSFPISLFDSPNPKRPTWGFHVHGGSGAERLPYRRLSRDLKLIPLTEAMITAVIEAWDTRYLSPDTAARTVNIETRDIRSNDFKLSAEQREELHRCGYQAALEFFGSTRDYFNSFGAGLSEPVAAG
ncbi:MAG: hypothetical protein QOD71_1055 [Thermoleophilaceae bacterium]|jgi:NTE family protein|nr:hypothetical protein [Thermoleophilaceae bacterium]